MIKISNQYTKPFSTYNLSYTLTYSTGNQQSKLKQNNSGLVSTAGHSLQLSHNYYTILHRAMKRKKIQQEFSKHTPIKHTLDTSHTTILVPKLVNP